MKVEITVYQDDRDPFTIVCEDVDIFEARNDTEELPNIKEDRYKEIGVTRGHIHISWPNSNYADRLQELLKSASPQ